MFLRGLSISACSSTGTYTTPEKSSQLCHTTWCWSVNNFNYFFIICRYSISTNLSVISFNFLKSKQILIDPSFSVLLLMKYYYHWLLHRLIIFVSNKFLIKSSLFFSSKCIGCLLGFKLFGEPVVVIQWFINLVCPRFDDIKML